MPPSTCAARSFVGGSAGDRRRRRRGRPCTRYVGSWARSSRKAIRRRASTGVARRTTLDALSTVAALSRRIVTLQQLLCRRCRGAPRPPCAAWSAAWARSPRAAIARMDEVLPWYRAMPAENRSWVNLVAQAGVAAFVEWFRAARRRRRRISADVFGTAPRELTRSVTLQQTVELVRVVIAVVEEQIESDRARATRPSCARRCCATPARSRSPPPRSTPQAAEARGAWDARLESLVVDALLRGEADDVAAVPGRGARAGAATTRSSWSSGTTPDAEPEAVVDEIRRAARAAHLDVLTGVQGDRLVAILGGAGDPVRATRRLVAQFGAGPVVVGPTVPDLLAAGAQRRGRRGRAAGRTGLAGRAAPGAGRRPAARAGARRRRAGPPAAGGARSTGRCRRPGRRWSRRCRRSWSRPRRWRRPPGCCSSTPTPCATGCAG